jgi:hypothetical protein
MIVTIISLVALIVAIFSFFIASERFRLDLYNKRFEIYVRTVKFYQALITSERNDEDETFASLRKDFILATRESQFLFSPESGVYGPTDPAQHGLLQDYRIEGHAKRASAGSDNGEPAAIL